MPSHRRFVRYAVVVVLSLLVRDIESFGQNTPRRPAEQQNKQNQSLRDAASRDQRRIMTLSEAVRHKLVTIPYYGVFDWLEANVTANGDVTLAGYVVKPTTKTDAEARLKDLESVSRVVNKIEVLPLSPNDDQLRIALHRAIFRFDSPLFRYGTAPVPSIHIIVANGHVRLKGVVATAQDGQLAYMAANGVSGIFGVQNELQVEKPARSK
jgi:hyperosmotically inducible periplasmic protein